MLNAAVTIKVSNLGELIVLPEWKPLTAYQVISIKPRKYRQDLVLCGVIFAKELSKQSSLSIDHNDLFFVLPLSFLILVNILIIFHHIWRNPFPSPANKRHIVWTSPSSELNGRDRDLLTRRFGHQERYCPLASKIWMRKADLCKDAIDHDGRVVVYDDISIQQAITVKVRASWASIRHRPSNACSSKGLVIKLHVIDMFYVPNGLFDLGADLLSMVRIIQDVFKM